MSYDNFLFDLQAENSQLRQQLSDAEQQMRQAVDLINQLQNHEAPERTELLQQLRLSYQNESDLNQHLMQQKLMQTYLYQQIEILHNQLSEYEMQLRFAGQERQRFQRQVASLEKTVEHLNGQWHYWAQMASAGDIDRVVSQNTRTIQGIFNSNGVDFSGVGTLQRGSRAQEDTRSVGTDTADERANSLEAQLGQERAESAAKGKLIEDLYQQLGAYRAYYAALQASRDEDAARAMNLSHDNSALQEARKRLSQLSANNDAFKRRNYFLEAENRMLRHKNEQLQDVIQRLRGQIDAGHPGVQDLDSAAPRRNKSAEHFPQVSLRSQAVNSGAQEPQSTSSEMEEEDNSIVHQNSQFDIEIEDLARSETAARAQVAAPGAPAREYKQKMSEFIAAQRQSAPQKIVVNAGLDDDGMTTPDNQPKEFQEPDGQWGRSDGNSPEQNSEDPDDEYEQAIEYETKKVSSEDIGDDIAQLMGSQGVGKSQGGQNGFGGIEYDTI